MQHHEAGLFSGSGTLVKDGGVPTVSWKLWLAPPTSVTALRVSG